MDREIRFKSIPGVKDGETCLTIYPPGTWMDNTDYMVFVGGCGVGRAKTLDGARRLLKRKALEYCQQRIDDASKTMEHYQDEYRILEMGGLRK